MKTIGIIVDDGSEVNVESIAREVGSDFRYLRREKEKEDLPTSSNAMNLGTNTILDRPFECFSSCELKNLAGVSYLHSDDRLFPFSMGLKVSKGTYFPFIYSDIQYDGPEGELRCLVNGSLYKKRVYTYFPHHTSYWELSFLRNLRDYCTEIYDTEGIFDSNLGAAEDWDVTISTFEFLKLEGLKPHYVPEVTYRYREHNDSISSNLNSAVRMKYNNVIINKHNFHFLDKITQRMGPMFLDLPWSLATYLPEEVKDNLRPYRDSTKRILLNS